MSITQWNKTRDVVKWSDSRPRQAVSERVS